ncbi:MAG: hypothetical protein PHC62_00180 [Candidatus Izemoplasmatales bacterium]|nr:hypothetical protein [Candidatus Izemoplasmatales bacterium]
MRTYTMIQAGPITNNLGRLASHFEIHNGLNIILPLLHSNLEVKDISIEVAENIIKAEKQKIDISNGLMIIAEDINKLHNCHLQTKFCENILYAIQTQKELYIIISSNKFHYKPEGNIEKNILSLLPLALDNNKYIDYLIFERSIPMIDDLKIYEVEYKFEEKKEK